MHDEQRAGYSEFQPFAKALKDGEKAGENPLGDGRFIGDSLPCVDPRTQLSEPF